MGSSKLPMKILVVVVVVFLIQGSIAQNCGSQAGGAICSGNNCCSQYGYCGSGDAWCGTGCQSGPCYSPGSGRCGSQGGGALCSSGQCCSQYGYCGTTSDYCGTGCQSGCSGGSTPSPPSSSCGSGVSSIVSSSLFNQVFPNRNSFYTFSAFITAANSYSGFGTTGSCDTRKREIAAFFAQISHETAGLFYINEINQNNAYCSPSAQYPCASGKKYFGRGPMQLSWNYNYKQFGDSINVDLVNNPELLATDAVISFKSAIWFWMTTQSPKPSCHNVMTGGWTPSSTDTANGRTATFGMTTVIINGGLECGSGASNPGGNTSRQNYYSSICSAFGVSTGGGTSCANMTPY